MLEGCVFVKEAKQNKTTSSYDKVQASLVQVVPS
jgi:hypothetical protein